MKLTAGNLTNVPDLMLKWAKLSAHVAETYQAFDAYEDLKRRGQERDFYIRIARENELFLDLDTDAHRAQFESMWPRFKNSFPAATFEATSSRTRGHCHVIVTLPVGLNALQRIAYQLILGSSPGHEMLCAERVREGRANPIVLYERKPPELRAIEKRLDAFGKMRFAKPRVKK